MLVPYTRICAPSARLAKGGAGAGQKIGLEVNVFSCLFVDIRFIVGY
jgi:hypothetical protein